jgi:hypothetical protein
MLKALRSQGGFKENIDYCSVAFVCGGFYDGGEFFLGE